MVFKKSMDNLVKENVIEKVKFKDIIIEIKNIIVGDTASEDEKTTNKKLQEIYIIEKELGATDSIENLTKDLERLEKSKKKSARNTGGLKVNKNIRQTVNSKNKKELQAEKQDEGKEL